MIENPRSCLSVPGSSPRMVDKALASAADEIVIDLEDAVAPAAKDAARTATVERLATVPPDRRVSVRVNAVGTAWCHEDLIALGSGPRRPDSIVVPKVESAGDLAFTERLLRGVAVRSGSAPIRVQALIESAAGLEGLATIASASPLLEALLLGYADLAANLGRQPVGTLWDPARERVLWAARTHGLRAIDGPWLGIQDDDDFRASVAAAAAGGYDGKWVIHPAQLDAVNESFAPTEDQLSWARRVIAALSEAESAGMGAVALDGAMLDEAVAVCARRLLARTGVAG